MSERSEEERKEVRKDFREVVNMSNDELREWLETEESQKVGQDAGDGESVGHKSGRRIIELKQKNVDEMDEDDHDWMKKTVGYVNRHLAQGGPDDDVENSKWRYSLMNWGHDPLKND